MTIEDARKSPIEKMRRNRRKEYNKLLDETLKEIKRFEPGHTHPERTLW